jgi:diguanylate cyclase (GGDEF)-like protein
MAMYLRPRIYQTGWFFSLCGLSVVALVYGGYRLRVRRMRVLATRLQRLVDERTAALADLNDELQQLTLCDSLTGLANRRHFDAVLETEWRRAQRTGAPIACVMLDIDNFGAFNERYGHLDGDACLKQIGAVLAAAAKRAGDLAARYGGEEFALILPAATLDGARSVAETLRAAVERLQIRHDASDAASCVTISAGVASTIPTRDARADSIVSAADRALYDAKHRGKNQVA